MTNFLRFNIAMLAYENLGATDLHIALDPDDIKLYYGTYWYINF